MIKQVYQVVVHYDESEVNYFSRDYARAVIAACKESIDCGSDYKGDTITEWATFENYHDALACEQVLERIRNTKELIK